MPSANRKSTAFHGGALFFRGIFQKSVFTVQKSRLCRSSLRARQGLSFLKSFKKDGKRARPADPSFSCGLFSFSSLKF
jgi:hypothetical protein